MIWLLLLLVVVALHGIDKLLDHKARQRVLHTPSQHVKGTTMKGALQ